MNLTWLDPGMLPALVPSPWQFSDDARIAYWTADTCQSARASGYVQI